MNEEERKAERYIRYLKSTREFLGFTQKELAQTLGVTPNTVARWERGELRMSRLAYLAIRSERRWEREARAQSERNDSLVDFDGETNSPIDASRLRQLLQLCHPDKHNNSKAATEVTAWLNGMRARKHK
ncbi:MAG: hypothetical protein JWL65_5372 [Gammaproteobacteria bacterium]|nr:hypothetical protein [Gammaproteobacteria bacterium]